ncbi:MAG: PIN domain-containing protein [Desulfococcaceae bacterium]
MCLVDANIVLRYVLDDHPELSLKAAEILEQHDAVMPVEVMCEVVYVLQKVYHVSKEQIQLKLSDLMDENLVNPEKPEVVKQALTVWCIKNIDIVDALLWAYHTVEGREVFTFDKKLHNCLNKEEA